MADIHVLKGSLTQVAGGVLHGRFPVAFHVPIDSPNPEVTFPDAESQVPGISTAESTAILDGLLFEIVEPWNHTTNKVTAEYVAMIKVRWAEVKAETNERYDYEYQYYLQELSA